MPTAIGAVVGIVIAGGGWLLLSGGDDDDPSVDSETAGNGFDDPEGTEPDDAEEPTTTEAGGDEDTETLTGTWQGAYQCAQGTTGLTLTVIDLGDGPVDATFAFAPTPENPGVPTGSYGMDGTIEEGSLSLEGLAWLVDPTGYTMVGLSADVEDRADPDTLEGSVVGDGCTTFSLERTSAEPWYVGTWTGRYICSQGLTGITLTVGDTGDGAVAAVYEFYEVPENPGVPSGSYSLTGEYANRSLSLEPDEWIDQPSGYVMVPLVGPAGYVVAPEFLAGRVDDPSCEGFMLTKDASAPAG